MDESIKRNREAIKPYWKELRKIETDRKKNLEKPALFKEISNTEIIKLPNTFPSVIQKTLSEVIHLRRSLRQYSTKALTLEEVAYLLWETSRVEFTKSGAVFRTIPTGGATNAMETYIYLNNVEGYQGLYLYHQNKHELALLKNQDSLREVVNHAIYNQLRGASVVFFFTTIPYRSEYKYHFAAHKMIAMEAGHAAQNLSLAAEVIECGACCIAAYLQDECDQLLEVDGVEEFTTYAVTVGKKQ